MAGISEERAELERELKFVENELFDLDTQAIGSEADAKREALLAARAEGLRQKIADLESRTAVGAASDTGHYDDGPAFGWDKASDDPGYQKPTIDLLQDLSDTAPPRDEPDVADARRRLVVGGFIVVGALALVALAALALFPPGGSDDSSPVSSAGTSHDAGTNTGGEASGSGRIVWGSSERQVSLSPELPGCVSSFVWTVTITNGARLAGKDAVVQKFGPDYPDHPTFTFTVGPSGSFEVPVDVKTCGGNETGVSLVSVDGNTNVFPKPPA